MTSHRFDPSDSLDLVPAGSTADFRGNLLSSGPSWRRFPGPLAGSDSIGTCWIPVVPESAPFTPEQRAWLNGFLAGLFSYVPAPQGHSQPPVPSLKSLTVLFASQTGNAEGLARRVAKEAARRGFAATVHDMGTYKLNQLRQEKNLLIVCSTYGDGEPPDHAKSFWLALRSDSAPSLSGLRYSVCALGDRNYPRFCQFGKDLDARLQALGAEPIYPRQDCDTDFEEPFAQWLAGVLAALDRPADNHGNGPRPEPTRNSTDDLVNIAAGQSPGPAATAQVSFSRNNPFPARLTQNRRLSGAGSNREVRHFVLSLEGSGLSYAAGDALGIWPINDPELVEQILRQLHCDGEEEVPGRNGCLLPLRLALQQHYDIVRLTERLLQLYAQRSADPRLQASLAPQTTSPRGQSLPGCHIIDLLHEFPDVRLSGREFVACLRPLQPRLYSIASSPLCYPQEVHLTVSVVRYESAGRPRKGVCSTYLADRVTPETPVRVFLHSNPGFRLPPPDTPFIMVGPGTGIAPFRAFLQERKALGARGRNWLFFGGQHQATDFLYHEEILAFQREGLLNRLDLAWSRDQDHKIYVQHLMLEHAAELWRWLEEGAAFYVCGDATRMARDVDAALLQVIQRGGGLSPDAAAEYVAMLRQQKRYCRDVY